MKRVRSFGGVGAWRVSSNSAVFLRRRDRGGEDAVVFPESGTDWFIDYTRFLIPKNLWRIQVQSATRNAL